MRIRNYEASDRSTFERMHALQGFDYELPDITPPTYFIRLVAEDPRGRVVMGAFAHLTAEIFFLCDPEAGDPETRYRRMVLLHNYGLELAYNPGGLDDLHCFPPPELAKKFGKRLFELGWKKALWPCYFVTLPRSLTHGPRPSSGSR